jgi:hypothetical protein
MCAESATTGSLLFSEERGIHSACEARNGADRGSSYPMHEAAVELETVEVESLEEKKREGTERGHAKAKAGEKHEEPLNPKLMS